MRFMGGKTRLAKHILPIMLAERKPNQYWVEPFVGGGNMIDKVEGNRIGSDIDPNVIDALTSIRDCVDELPRSNRDFTEEDYKSLRRDDNFNHKGFAGFAYSFGGKWMGGWSRYRDRDYIAQAYRSAEKQSPLLRGVKLENLSYKDLSIPPNSIIYCDPPYRGTTQYRIKFDHDVFWEWCREKSKEGHTVFISEYNAPDDFECIHEKLLAATTSREGSYKYGCEKLFKYKGDKDESKS